MSELPKLKCPLCGFEFEKQNAVCHHGCPMGRFCKLIKCPSCQYEFPEPSQPFSWLAKLLHPARVPLPAGTLDLTQLETGQTAEFVGVAGNQKSREHTLSLYGLVPGAQLTLLQKSPAFVVRVGETELALEASIAQGLLIRGPGDGK